MSTAEFTTVLVAQEVTLRQMGFHFTNNRDDLQDLIQDTLARALRYKDRFVDGTNLKSWLFVMMKNIYINQYNQNVGRKTFADGTPGEYYLNAHGANTESLTERQLIAADLQDSISKLSEKFRTPFELHVEGYQYDEIADELDIPIGTVKSRIFKARERLQDMLADYSSWASKTTR